jgi:reversibly glycosylated polypeptide/UDP-arabinopyranose mutase
MNTVLVIPTNREQNIKEFLKAWNTSPAGDWHQIVVVEDNPEKTFDINLADHYSWKEIDEEFGDNKWVISRRDSAIRSFGFWKAYEMGADYIFTLDDDCFPLDIEDEDFFCDRHLQNILKTPKWTELVPNKRTRGLPYFNKGTLGKVVANVGLWCGVPDLDAIETLAKGRVTNYTPPAIDRVVPAGQYFPWCGMNFAFSREIAVLAYFPLMGEGSPYRRFDDIWFGVICKRILDHLGLRVTVGRPWVRHKKASDPMVNLVKEAPGVKTNEHFWELIEGLPISGTTPAMCMEEVGDHLSNNKDDYFKRLGEAICRWVSMF